MTNKFKIDQGMFQMKCFDKYLNSSVMLVLITRTYHTCYTDTNQQYILQHCMTAWKLSSFPSNLLHGHCQQVIIITFSNGLISWAREQCRLT